MSHATVRVAYDSGWSDGDPGNGRLRFDAPRISQARNICINARDAQDALLDQLVPTWGVGDVIVIERPGAEVNKIIAWVMGPVYHRGSYWRVPVSIRTVYGAFAAHDELLVHHSANVIEDDRPNGANGPSIPDFAHIAQPSRVPPPLAPMAPMAQPLVPAGASAPQNIAAPATQADGARERALLAENQALQTIIAQLVSDDTPLYSVEATHG